MRKTQEITLRRGVFILSIDTELAWGCFDRPDREERWRLEEQSREVIRRLLELFARYDISATWAVVGHLFLRECRSQEGRTHANMPHPAYSWFPYDWYHFDPATDASQAPLWYGPDIIQQLLEAQPTQEIASHSFAHPIFADSGCSLEAADADIAACVQAAGTWEVKLRSFVFPRNRVGHLNVLARHGFRCYRGEDPAWFASLPRLPRRLAHYLDDLLALPPPTVQPQCEGGLWNIPGSMMLQGRDGIRRWIPSWCRTHRGMTGLCRAARRREVFHLWFHPINFSVECDQMLDALELILQKAAALRDKGALDILTMRDLTERLVATDI